ncbi:acyl-CoA thioesterase [Ruminiclostridium josui]|uniref:acyl-CoA thioesterase n=1 Tax=Ruminiclostridium josui TaxID=1499 RepID=UPI0004655417|nr:acyl-CoA thioesterase [Ruminiclostridium josui]
MMLISTHCIEHTVTFSECDYFGTVKNSSCLCWFEDARFQISLIAGIQGYFLPEHRSQTTLDKQPNDTEEYYTMPVLQNSLESYKEIRFGTEILVHTWLEMPIAAYCVFHHYITSKDCKTVFYKCDTTIGLVGQKSGLIKDMPNDMYNRIIYFIKDIQNEFSKYNLEIDENEGF